LSQKIGEFIGLPPTGKQITMGGYQARQVVVAIINDSHSSGGGNG
jgi:hypothetical protein